MRNLHIYIVAFILIIASLFGVEGVAAQNYSIPVATVDLSTKSNNELWDMANTAYANDDYIGAEEYYNEILSRDVHSSAIYYNLGNVHYKRGEVGRALLNYYRALRIDPSDEDIRHNIEVVRAKTADNIEQLPRLFIVEWSEWIGSRLSCMQWSILSLILLALFFGFLLTYILAGGLKTRRAGFWGALILLVLLVVTTRHALIERSELLNPSEAIVMSSSMSVNSSPSSASTELFILHEGTKVKILNRHDVWSEIKIADGKKGWVESRKIEQI
ncbi:MAG: competence protein [Rikenellaceae bacterium]